MYACKHAFMYVNHEKSTTKNHSKYCITGNVNVYFIFLNLPHGFETVTIKTLTLIVFVGMVWQTMFVGDDVYAS